MEKYVIFDYIQEGYVTGIRKNAYGTSPFSCNALCFPSLDIAQSFVSILDNLFSDTYFRVMCL